MVSATYKIAHSPSIEHECTYESCSCGKRPLYTYINGEQFLMLRSGTAAETLGLVVVEHWFEGLKRLVPVP